MPTGAKINDAQALLLHRLLAEYHRDIAAKAGTTLIYNYHEDLCWRLDHEADQIQDRIVLEEENPCHDRQI
jgi:hypothetical protein